MAYDVEALLAPIEGDDPAGPDLAYDSARQEIEQAFETSVSIDSSGAAEAASDIDWRKTIATIVKQLGQTKDIWLAVYLARAGVRSGDLDAAVAGVQTLAGMLETQWDDIHPKLEELGVPGRKSPCDSLGNLSQFVGPLQRGNLLVHPRLGAFSGQDLIRFEKEGAEAEGYGQFRAAVEDSAPEVFVDILGRIDALDSGLKRADQAFVAKVGGGEAPNFAIAYETLGGLRRALLAFAPALPDAEPAAGEAAPDAEAAADSPPPRADAPAPRIGGRVDSRDDVLKAIDAICEYYRRVEPTSPVPLALKRARDWVSLDFLSVLEDIAPGGLGEAKGLLSARKTAGKHAEVEESD